MQTRMTDLVKALTVAVDRRRALDPLQLSRLEDTLSVLRQDHQTVDGPDLIGRLGVIFRLDSTDLDLLLVAAAADVDINVALA